MHRIIMLSLVLVCFAPVASTQSLAEEWSTYFSAVLSVEIQYPSHWKFKEEFESNYVMFSPSTNNDWLYGQGPPSPPNPWFEIFKIGGEGCDDIQQTQDFQQRKVLVGRAPTYQEKIECREESFVLVAGYWDSDMNKLQARAQLNYILRSFRIVPRDLN